MNISLKIVPVHCKINITTHKVFWNRDKKRSIHVITLTKCLTIYEKLIITKIIPPLTGIRSNIFDHHASAHSLVYVFNWQGYLEEASSIIFTVANRKRGLKLKYNVVICGANTGLHDQGPGRWFNDKKDLKMLMNFIEIVWLLLMFSIYIIGPATVQNQIQNQILWSAYMYIYCHSVNFEFTGWVEIQSLQHDNCKFCDLHPPSKLKIYIITKLLIVFPLL